MTDGIRGTGGPDGPPWSVDLLADLHAGVLDPRQSSRLWRQVDNDPDARAILDALESVKTDLGDLRDAPVEPMPAHFAASLDAALAAEAQRAFGGSVAVRPTPAHGSTPVIDLAAARRKRNRMAGWGIGVLTAAAAAVAVTFVAIPGGNTTDGKPQAIPTSETNSEAPGAAQPPLALTKDNLGGAVGAVASRKDYGPLKDQAGLDKCIEANKLDPAKVQTVGVRPVTLDGTAGVMALLTAGEPGSTFRVLVVEPNCTALFNDTIGR
ncbi:MAG: hypothetical protein M3548_22000 [Actinomycetota bacterium]|nr:hypothetical protein [Actinomycetota bacterium]